MQGDYPDLGDDDFRVKVVTWNCEVDEDCGRFVAVSVVYESVVIMGGAVSAAGSSTQKDGETVVSAFYLARAGIQHVYRVMRGKTN